jgi:isochorismate hydrolase
MRAVDYYPPNLAEELPQKWVGSLDRKRKWRGGPGRTALLILDIQRFFTDPESHAYIPSSGTIIDNIRALIREYKGPVIITKHVNEKNDNNLMALWWRDVVSGDMADIDPSLPYDDDQVVEKNHYSAFHETELEDRLRGMGIDTVLITGLMTDLCCESTARDAFMRGFKVIFLADCTATETEERHLCSLKVISRAFGEVLTSKELPSLL